MIKPTVGRIVWFRPNSADGRHMQHLDPQQPLAAIVVHVHDDRTVNLTVLNQGGTAYGRLDVPLIQEDETPPEGSYCEWMPFQKGQAAKAEALEREIHAHGSPHIATSSSEIAGS